MTTKEKLETVFGKIEQSEFINAARNKRMTKEQIVNKLDYDSEIPLTSFQKDIAIKAMQEHTDQELAKQGEKVSKLIDAINSVISLGYDSEILKNALSEYYKTS